MLTVKDAIQQRRAIRSFRPDPVPEELLQQILEAARLAPSSMNFQPWRFVVARSPALRQELAKAARNQTAMQEAPVIIICCAELKAYDNERVHRLLEETPQVPPVCVSPEPNTFIAIAYMTIMATALGLGTVWVGVNLSFRAIRAGKTNLLTWLRETIATTKAATGRLLESAVAQSRPEIIIRYRDYLRTTIEQLQKTINEVQKAASADAAAREKSTARLTTNLQIVDKRIAAAEQLMAGVGA